MIFVFYLLIGLWTIGGLVALLFPAKMRDFYLRITNSNAAFKIWGIVALLVAYCLEKGAALLAVPLFGQVLAILAGIKGILLLLVPRNKWTKMVSWLIISNIWFRVFGTLALVLAYWLYTLI